MSSGYATVATAVEFGYGVGYVGEYASNIKRTSFDEENEWTNSLIAGLVFRENTNVINTRLSSQVEYRNYVRNTFEDETLFTLDASAVWAVSPQRFTWTIEDAHRQVTLNPRQAPTPANRASINVFSTGPDFYVPLGALTTLSLGARYGNINVEDSESDNKRHSEDVEWVYRFSPITTFSLNYQSLNVSFDNDILNENFVRRDLFVRAQTKHATQDVALDIGTTKVERDRSSDLDKGLGRFSWTRKLTPESSFGLKLRAEYSDIGTEYAATPVSVADELAFRREPSALQDILTSDVFYTKSAEVIYSRRRHRFGADLTFRKREIQFETSPLEDRKESGVIVEIPFNYSSAFTVAPFGDYTKTEYLAQTRTDTDRDMGVRFSYQFRRNLLLSIEGKQVRRVSSDPGAEFKDNRGLITILYSSGALFRR